MKRTVNLLLAASLAGCASMPIPTEGQSIPVAINEYTLARQAAFDAGIKAYAKTEAADAAYDKSVDKCVAAAIAGGGRSRKAFAAYIDDACDASDKAWDYSVKLYDEAKAAGAAFDQALADEQAAAAQEAAAERDRAAAIAQAYLAEQARAAAAAEWGAAIRDAALIYAVSRPAYVPPPVYVAPPVYAAPSGFKPFVMPVQAPIPTIGPLPKPQQPLIRCRWDNYGGSCY